MKVIFNTFGSKGDWKSQGNFTDSKTKPQVTEKFENGESVKGLAKDGKGLSDYIHEVVLLGWPS
jgi:hypothetical protein